MNPKFTKVLVALALALLVVPAAFAQTTGRIDGTVTDDQGAPLPGVTVTVSSASLQGERPHGRHSERPHRDPLTRRASRPVPIRTRPGCRARGRRSTCRCA